MWRSYDDGIDDGMMTKLKEPCSVGVHFHLQVLSTVEWGPAEMRDKSKNKNGFSRTELDACLSQLTKVYFYTCSSSTN